MLDKLIEHVKASNYPDATEYRVENSRPNAAHYEIDCSEHKQSECVVIKLHDVYYNDTSAALVAESACGHLQTWMD